MRIQLLSILCMAYGSVLSMEHEVFPEPQVHYVLDEKKWGYNESQWNPDGRKIAQKEYAFYPGLRILNTETNSESLIGTHVRKFVWSPDGRYVALIRSDGQVDVFQDNNSQKISSFSPGAVIAVPNPARLGGALLALDGLRGGDILGIGVGVIQMGSQTIEGYSDVELLVWSPCGNYIAVKAEKDTRITIWTRTGQMLKHYNAQAHIEIIKWDATSRYVAAADEKKLYAWDRQAELAPRIDQVLMNAHNLSSMIRILLQNINNQQMLNLLLGNIILSVSPDNAFFILKESERAVVYNNQGIVISGLDLGSDDTFSWHPQSLYLVSKNNSENFCLWDMDPVVHERCMLRYQAVVTNDKMHSNYAEWDPAGGKIAFVEQWGHFGHAYAGRSVKIYNMQTRQFMDLDLKGDLDRWSPDSRHFTLNTYKPLKNKVLYYYLFLAHKNVYKHKLMLGAASIVLFTLSLWRTPALSILIPFGILISYRLFEYLTEHREHYFQPKQCFEMYDNTGKLLYAFADRGIWNSTGNQYALGKKIYRL